MTALITRADMILPVLVAAGTDRLPAGNDEVCLAGENVTDLVDAMYHCGLLYGVGTDAGDRWLLTGAGQVLRDAVLADPTLVEMTS